MGHGRKRDGHIEQRTLTRRTLLEWLGKGATMALGAQLAAACGADVLSGSGRSDLGADGGWPWHAGRGGHDLGFGDDAAQPGQPDGGRPDPADGGRQSTDSGGGEPDAGTDPADASHASDGASDSDAGGPTPRYDFEPGEPEGEFLRVWGERTVDPQDPAAILRTWQLRVDGLVRRPVTLSFADIVGLPRQDQVTDFHCVEGWSVWDVPWSGVHLSRIMQRVRPLASATHVTFHTIGGTYNESLPLPVALEPRTLLAYGVAGTTLPLRHGFPLRIVIPRLLGYKSAKYVHRIELADAPLHGFWIERGYPYEGEVPAGRLREGHY